MDDEAQYCSKCGRYVEGSGENNRGYNTYAPQTSSPSALSILGLILSFFMTIVGLVISIVAYNNAKSANDYGSQGLAKAGIIVASVELGLGVLAVLAYVVIVVVIIVIGGTVAGGTVV